MRTLRRIIPGLLVLAFVLAAGWQSARRGMSEYYLEKAKTVKSDVTLQKALAFDPGNPNAAVLLGLTLHQRGLYGEACSAFDKAIASDPTSYLLRSYRARSRSLLGDVAGAESDYLTSIALAPNYAEPQKDLGRLLLRANRPDEAFRYLARAASADESSLPEVLDLARQTYPNDGLAILRAVSPSSEAAKKQTLLYLVDHDMASDDLVPFVRDALSDESSQEVVRELITLKKFRIAHAVWQAKREQETGYPVTSDLLIDGDFESQISERNTAFGWQVVHDRSKIQISVSENGGVDSRGLEIQFSGDSDPTQLFIWQLVPVFPKHKYRLTYVSNPENLVSGGLPVVSILDAANNNLLGESSPLGSSQGIWQSAVIDFSVSDHTEGILIGIRRHVCKESPCPIFGRIRLDNFILRLRHTT